MSSIDAKIRKVKDILDQNLKIPNYQRPYRWEEKHVFQLLEDIFKSWKEGKTAYRIGSLILHEKEGKDEKEKDLEIVDGQQRITTLTLIFLSLDEKRFYNYAEKLHFSHDDSKYTIKRNFVFIKEWLGHEVAQAKVEFLNYLLEACEFVEVKVKKTSEAFQMFDSQNSRGKSLEAYNLLKAYHIRAMESEAETLKVDCDRRWESAIRFYSGEKEPKDILKQLFEEQLYRTRLWSRKEYAYRFSKEVIGEFKGKTIEDENSVDYPYQNTYLLQRLILQNSNLLGSKMKGIKPRFMTRELPNVNPFVSINQPIINGKLFFDFIESYTEIYKQLFIYIDDKSCLGEFKTFYDKYCNYKTNRVGDSYLKELYKSLVMLVFDKYGEEGLNEYYKVLYTIVYRLRVEKFQVKYNAVMKYAADKCLFVIIDESKGFVDLRALNALTMDTVVCRRDEALIIRFLCEQNVKISKHEDLSIDVMKKYKNSIDGTRKSQ
ncbi:DUF262 domain-containing protein [Aureispira sp. CCB-E]|uniref:DUF262 domain-containing protein n=1 Tax=Aureispira sp. CCB-E TaxID=3051121 RepID=UPI0028690BB3|nr:DUF262 domain-containing protein [Aureispira sp. CCB-E]WMX17026.1 DUF262 domain-containing protein [Aureispira sp. CCB-E]